MASRRVTPPARAAYRGAYRWHAFGASRSAIVWADRLRQSGPHLIPPAITQHRQGCVIRLGDLAAFIACKYQITVPVS